MRNKQYYIVAVLDDECTNAIRKIQKEIGIELDNLNDIPHITLIAYKDEINIIDLLEWVNKFAQNQKSVEICLHMLAVSNEQLYAVPCFTKDLYEMHHNIRQKYDDYCLDYFKKNYWLPHVTITYDGKIIINEKMSMITDLFQDIRLTFFKLNSLWVSCLDEDRVLTILGKFPLQD